MLAHLTSAHWISCCSDMVAKAEDGDVLFFHFSGHGTQVSHDEAV